MKILLLAAGLLSFGTLVVPQSYVAADAQGYYSQRARQDREYKSLSQSTQRAYGTTNRR